MAGPAQRQQEISSKRPLHNFTLPSELKWGHRKHLRCDKSTHGNNPNSTPRSNTTTHFADYRKSPISGSGGDNEIEVVREKLKNHNEKKTSEEDSNSVRPWNLRTRRAACKGSIDAGVVMGNIKLSPLRSVTVVDRAESKEGNNGKKAKFSSILTKEEIEKDFLAMTGAKPPKRPKKRPRIVQKQLDGFFPGLWLTEIMPEIYNVQENSEGVRGEGNRNRFCRDMGGLASC